MQETEIIPKRVYRHYKGNVYFIHAIATFEKEKVVIISDIYTGEFRLVKLEKIVGHIKEGQSIVPIMKLLEKKP